MDRQRFLLFVLLISSFNILAQPGRLLLVGGGAEKNGASSWSTPAYKWAGEGKKVAIVGISTGTLAPYFKQQCGAARAKEFAIATHDSANSQATYDTLVSYDVIFFRGGDQYDYYNLYRNTKLQDAVAFLFSHGGTICGTSAGLHILSSIVYTAKNGSAYSDECIENPNNNYVTLANDFMNLVPGFVFDTHFAERGRFGRLVGFLANYKLNQGQYITGLGMDDMTCMTVDENGLGTVYGTGCANIYKAGAAYSLNGTKLLADTVHIIQLLHGCTWDFATGQAGFTSLNRLINTSGAEETGNFTVLASGGNALVNNQAMLGDLVNSSGTPSASILLLSGDLTLAATYKTRLLELGAPKVDIFTANIQSGTDTVLGNRINMATKILFLKNSFPTFSPFLATTNGVLLLQRIKQEGMITAFVGDDARLAGKTVIENYLTALSSYYAELTFGNGLALLPHTVLMPDTYLNSDVYENTVTAIPYAMARDTLKFGIWLTDHNYMKFTPVAGKTTLTGYGTAPVMVIANAGTLAGFSSHSASGSTSTKPRMIAGFEHLKLSLIDYTTPYVMGSVHSSGLLENNSAEPLIISPNPAHKVLTLKWNSNEYSWEIINLHGIRIFNGKSGLEPESVDVSTFTPGVYIVKMKNNINHQTRTIKFIKE
ncbi:MAG: T9SS type A sorting domain-containing protein [Bacteroidales bacterium]